MTQNKRIKRGKGILDAINNLLFGRKSGVLPPAVRKFIEQHGTEKITDARVCRKAISITGFVRAATLGKSKEYLNSKNFDELFHLWIEVLTSSGGNYLVEKNHVIEVSINPNVKDAECMPCPLNGNEKTIAEAFENTKKRMGDAKFTGYSGRNNNCQDFILNFMASNGYGNEEVRKFVKQDTEKVFMGLPSIVEKLMNLGTTLRERIDTFINGQGLRRRKPKTGYFLN